MLLWSKSVWKQYNTHYTLRLSNRYTNKNIAWCWKQGATTPRNTVWALGLECPNSHKHSHSQSSLTTCFISYDRTLDSLTLPKTTQSYQSQTNNRLTSTQCGFVIVTMVNKLMKHVGLKSSSENVVSGFGMFKYQFECWCALYTYIVPKIVKPFMIIRCLIWRLSIVNALPDSDQHFFY